MSIVLLTSCATKTEYIYVVSPVDTSIFPTFPVPVDSDGNSVIEYDSDSDMVMMPSWYLLAITDFKIDYKATLEKLDSKYDSK